MYLSTAPVNPWLHIWFSPRRAVATIVEADPRRAIIQLSALSGISLFSLVNLNPPRSPQALLINLGMAIILGALFGLIFLYLGSRLLHRNLRWWGSGASLEEVRVAMVWATLPRTLLLSLWLLPFLPPFAGTVVDGQLSSFYVLFVTGLAVVCLSWELFIFLQGMTAIDRLSLPRLLAAGIVASTLFLAATAALFLLMRSLALRLTPATSPIFTVSLLVMGLILSLLAALRSTDDTEPEEGAATRLESWRPALQNLDEMAMARPWSERIARPLWRRVQRLGERITPQNRIAALQKELLIAGHPRGLTLTDFLGLRFLSVALIGALVVLYSTLAGGGPQTFAILGMGFILGWNLPDFWLRKRITKRQKEIQRSLPDALDMLSICVDAGLGFEAAILRVSGKWDNELARELQRVVNEIRVGVRRSEALHNLTERCDVPDVASFVAILIQADRLGISIGPVLQSQSEQMRVRRRQRAEEEAQKAPVKMLMPLALFILPATFAVSLGPAVPRIMRMFG